MTTKKARLFQKFLRTKEIVQSEAFKTYRNKMTAKLKKAMASYYCNVVSDIYEWHPNQVWKAINQALNRNTIQNNSMEITINGNNVPGVPLADHFTEQIANVVQPLGSTAFTQVAYHGIHTIYLVPTGEAEVGRTFLSLENSKAVDVIEYQVEPIKHVKDLLAPCLAYVFNRLLQSGCFPDLMKISKVSAICKSGGKNDANDYRAISILPVFSKELEKIFCYSVNSILI